MRFRTLEIRWHDSKPISTCDFQPIPFKRARPPTGNDDRFAGHSYRLATGGEDNHVRVWMVYPNIRPTSLVKDDPNPAAPRPPRIEYLSTLSRHSAAVNVVRFSPNGELIASAGDDGMIIIWAQSTNPHSAAYGSDIPPDELQLDKEFWKPRTTFRCTTMQVYDLAWSPTGEYIIAGSTDNTARVFSPVDGKCVCEIAEHNHFVQGVAWDPLNEYIATQSSDRSMHIYRISTKNGTFETHAVSRNTKMPHHHHHNSSTGGGGGGGSRHTRTPSAHSTSASRPKMFRSESSQSDAESAVEDVAPLTPATSVASTPSLAMFPPPPVLSQGGGGGGGGAGGGQGGAGPSSRRSSFSASSNAPNSPHSSFRYGRSPSPMPPLPAIRNLPATSAWVNVKLYGDESYTNFFRRLTFSPDGGLLLSPAGQFQDPIIIPPSLSNKAGNGGNGGGASSGPKEEGGGGVSGAATAGGSTPKRGRKGRPSVITETSLAISSTGAGATTSAGNTGGAASAAAASTSMSSVYIYSRANFARPPIAQLPGHKKASVAVRFSPMLYELRPHVEAATATTAPAAAAASGDRENASETKTAALERGVEGTLDVDVTGPIVIVSPAPNDAPTPSSSTQTYLLSPQRTCVQSQTPNSLLVSPLPRLALSTSQLEGGSNIALSSPGLSPMELRPPTPATSKPPTPAIHAHNQAQSQTAGGGGSASITTIPTSTASVFALPYRMLYAVLTMDTVAIYDTQQAGPVCLLTNLHYDEFTDMTWSSDGQSLLLSSRDGYCTIIIFDEILPTSHTQQHALQLQSIAHHNSVPLVSSSAANTPATSTIGLPHLHTHTPTKKRSEPPLTPAASTDGEGGGNASYFVTQSSSNTTPTIPVSAPAMGSGTASSGIATAAAAASSSGSSTKESQKRQAPGSSAASGADDINAGGASTTEQQPPKKKRRVALTRVADLDS